MRVRVHAPGPAAHGVVRHAAAVSRLTGAHGVRTVTEGGLLTHAHFTDALFGPDVSSAAEAFAGWAASVRGPLVVTVHDVPGADPDRRRDRLRAAGYARVVAAADAVVVSSGHEAAKVSRLSGARSHLIDLPLPEPGLAGRRPEWADRPTLGVLGFVYPGKGHREAVDAAARSGANPRVVAAGPVSPGHQDLARELDLHARRRGVDLVRTGALTDADLRAAAAAVTVPLALNSRVSASGSLLTWLACGRRPLAARGEYASEVDRRHPGVLALCGTEAELDDALAEALTDPASTLLPGSPPWPDVGGAHAALYRSLC